MQIFKMTHTKKLCFKVLLKKCCFIVQMSFITKSFIDVHYNVFWAILSEVKCQATG